MASSTVTMDDRCSSPHTAFGDPDSTVELLPSENRHTLLFSRFRPLKKRARLLRSLNVISRDAAARC